MNHVVVLEIKNTVENYAAVVEHFSPRHSKSLSRELKTLDWKDTFDLLPEELQTVVNNQLEKKDGYLLIIDVDNNDNDIVNLQYLVALLDRYDSIVAFLRSAEKEAFFKLGLFIKPFCHPYNRIFASRFEKDGTIKYMNLPPRMSDMHSRITPVFKLNPDYIEAPKESSEPWNLSVNQFRASPKTHAFLYNQCKKLLAKIGLENEELFLQETKYISVLAYYLLCLIFANRKTVDKQYLPTSEQLRQDILFVSEIAEGFLQLMENSVLHTEQQCGYVYFRIHDKDDNAFLSDKYPDFKNKEQISYLEMQLLDFSFSSNIPNKFVQNIYERKNNSIDDEKEKLEQLLLRHHELLQDNNLSLKFFFKPTTKESKFWNGYNQIGSNVAHHYGMQIFDSIVQNRGAIFRAISSENFEVTQRNREYYFNNTSKKLSRKIAHLPGSEFSVLIPLREYKSTQKIADLNAQIDYRTELTSDYKIISLGEELPFSNKLITEYYHESPSEYTLTKRKEYVTNRFSQDIQKFIELADSSSDGARLIFWYDAKTFALGRVEFFCKAVFILISRNLGKKLNLMITNCDPSFMLEIVRIFSLFFNKQGENQLLKDFQLYLRGTKQKDEFLFAGQNLLQIYSRSSKLSFARCTNTQIATLVSALIQDRTVKKPEVTEETFILTPFDMVEFPDGRKSLFETDVEETLQANIRSDEFGCKHEKAHVRVGSKIHLADFYEAELLFHNKFYTARFSEMLCKKILKLSPDHKNNLVLVAYETYSETLVSDIIMKLDAQSIHATYVICDEKNDYIHFLDRLNQEKSENYNFILIVPVNSALTTHNKLRSMLCTKLKVDVNSISIVANYAVILLSELKGEPSCDKDILIDGASAQGSFWETHNPKYKRIKPKPHLSVEPEIEYLINIPAEWFLAETCELCIPPNNVLEEMPLIETNRESTVPMQKISPKEENNTDCESSYLSEENMRRIAALAEHTLYQHICQGENHFIYFFDCESYFTEQRNSINAWLKGINISNKASADVFDIIVTPLNSDNTGFTELFNETVFNQPALVLRLDVNREYRSNIQTKYKHLKILYDNIVATNSSSVIRFHFVDSTIYSGRTFQRAESLIRSVFPRTAIESGIVSVFYSITLLINRISNDSKYNYTAGNEHYNAYVNVNISPMRTHDDACTQCKLVHDFERLSSYSSTQNIYGDWRSKMHDHKEKNIVDVYKQPLDICQKSNNQRRASLRLITTHIAASELSRYQGESDFEILQLAISKLILAELDEVDFLSKLVSYLKVISRPFIFFDQGIKPAIFKTVLYLTHFLVTKDIESISACIDSSELKDNITQICNEICKLHGEEKYKLLIVLINRLSAMGSNYLLRKDSINCLTTYVENKHAEKKQDFMQHFNLAVKRLTTLSSDDVRSLRLEDFLASKIKENAFGEFYSLYTENNIVLKNALKDLEEKLKLFKTSEGIKVELSKYYYNGFREMFAKNGLNIDFERTFQLTKFAEELTIYLKKKDQSIESFKTHYDKLCRYYVECTGAIKARLLIDDYPVAEYNCSRDNSDYTTCRIRFEHLIQQNEKESSILDAKKVLQIYSIYPKNMRADEIVFYERMIYMFREEIVAGLAKGFETGVLQEYQIRESLFRALTGMNAIEHDTLSADLDYNLQRFDDLSIFRTNEITRLAMSYIFQAANRRLSAYYRRILNGKSIKVGYKHYAKQERQISLLPFFENKGLFYQGGRHIISENDDYMHSESNGVFIKLRNLTPNKKGIPIRLRGEYDESLLIALLMFNAAKHCKLGSNRLNVDYEFCSGNVILRNEWNVDAETADVRCKELRKWIETQQIPHNHITLWTINAICKDNGRGPLKISFKENEKGKILFCVELPIILKEEEFHDSHIIN